MQPVFPVVEDVVPTSIVPTDTMQQMPIQAQQQQLHQQLQQQQQRQHGGIQIPTSMEQMKGQATTLLKKIAPTPPAAPPEPQKMGGTGPMAAGAMMGDECDTNNIIGGKIDHFLVCRLRLRQVCKLFSQIVDHRPTSKLLPL